MARSGAIALWCQTVMSRVQGNTINTMARISLLFGISRIGYLARHYLGIKRDFSSSHFKDHKSNSRNIQINNLIQILANLNYLRIGAPRHIVLGTEGHRVYNDQSEESEI